MAHIRSKFSKSKLEPYHLKKYVWKLLYMHMLGYVIDIGHMEALKLVSGRTYSEKCCGYMACALLFNEESELLRLIIQSVKKDLEPQNEVSQCLALACVANIGGQELAESLAMDVQNLLCNGISRSFVKKKAALCLLRLCKKYPDVVSAEELAPKINTLLQEPHYGVAVSVSALLLGVVERSPRGYESCMPVCIELLSKLAFSQDRKSIYKYYNTISPWLQVKMLRILQYFPPPKDKNLLTRLNHTLSHILKHTEMTEYPNKNNGDHSILFEAMGLIIHHCHHGERTQHETAVAMLAKFISKAEPNFRYLGLETMARFARIEGTLEALKNHTWQAAMQYSLKDNDNSIRKVALDLLYWTCDKDNSREVVTELLKYLVHFAYNLREELVLKIAILAEKFAVNLRWYIDVVLQLISIAGDFVSDDIWHRVVQIVTNNDDLQDYAASTCFKFLSAPTVHETGIKVGAYILGEFGHRIKDKAVTGEKIFNVLRAKCRTAQNETKALILSSFIKMANTHDELKGPIRECFEGFMCNADAELQQRASEYLSVLELGTTNEDLMNDVFDVMPDFPQRESRLLKRLYKAAKGQGKWDKKKETDEGDDDDDDDDDDDSSSDSDSDSDSGSDSDSDSGSGSGNDDEEKTSSPSKKKMWPSQDKSHLLSLYGQSKGAVYETPALQIGCSHKVEGSTLKMVLYYGNRTNTPMVDVTCQVPKSDALSAQVSPSDSFEVQPNKQVKQFLAWRVLRPFTEAPMVKINFKHQDKKQSLLLPLPFLASNFVAPAPVSAAEFPTKWKEFAGNEEKQQLRLKSLLTVEQFKTRLAASTEFTVIEGLGGTDNVFASGTMAVGSSQMQCLLFVETKPNLPVMRVTAHCQHKLVSAACVESLSAIFDCTRS